MVDGRRARRERVLQVSEIGRTPLTELWQRRWADCPPVAHQLRGPYREVWVRFHSLPESKRYAQDDHEYAIVLDRYNTPGPVQPAGLRTQMHIAAIPAKARKCSALRSLGPVASFEFDATPPRPRHGKLTPSVGIVGVLDSRSMATIVVLLELEQDQALGPDGVEPVVIAVHAAGADPDVPEDPLPRTLCGLETEPMEHAHYRPARPGEPWYPPGLSDRRCHACETLLRSL